MDLMKVFDQTVRDLKREVNTRVLKVPEIEQKVLDATSNEPWGPHGTVLQEIAQATKNFTECQMIMNVLWTRLADTGRNWRHVYKALSVIEYLVANGAERVVDDIIEHTYQISSISEFEYVEPNGKDVGINVRKKVETILALLNNKDKIQEVRQKAAANRDKYFGLSSTGITFKSSSASYGGSAGFGSNDRFGSQSGGREEDTFKDSYKDRDTYGEESDWKHGKGDNHDKDDHDKSRSGITSENEGSRSKKEATSYGRDQDAKARLSPESSHADRDGGPAPSSQSLRSPPKNVEDDFDDFDPRGTSKGATTVSFNQVDLLDQDLFDAPTIIPATTAKTDGNIMTEVDLFADADFVSAVPHAEGGAGSHAQPKVDLFAQQPAFAAAFPSTVDFFAASGPSLRTGSEKEPKSEPINSTAIDPFAAVPLNNFEGSELFGDFTSHTDSLSTEPTQGSASEVLKKPNQNIATESKPPPKKDNFQIKSGIWADSLSRGLIDLNISAPKKVDLADLGIVGGLSDGSEEKAKAPTWTTSYMGRAMGSGSGLGRSGFTSTVMGEGSYSSQNLQHHGGFK